MDVQARVTTKTLNHQRGSKSLCGGPRWARGPSLRSIGRPTRSPSGGPRRAAGGGPISARGTRSQSARGPKSLSGRGPRFQSGRGPRSQSGRGPRSQPARGPYRRSRSGLGPMSGRPSDRRNSLSKASTLASRRASRASMLVGSNRSGRSPRSISTARCRWCSAGPGPPANPGP
jgi:hypothetical protein